MTRLIYKCAKYSDYETIIDGLSIHQRAYVDIESTLALVDDNLAIIGGYENRVAMLKTSDISIDFYENIIWYNSDLNEFIIFTDNE